MPHFLADQGAILTKIWEDGIASRGIVDSGLDVRFVPQADIECRQLMARLVAARLPLDHVLDGYCSGLFENQRAVDPVALFGGLL